MQICKGCVGNPGKASKSTLQFEKHSPDTSHPLPAAFWSELRLQNSWTHTSWQLLGEDYSMTHSLSSLLLVYVSSAEDSGQAQWQNTQAGQLVSDRQVRQRITSFTLNEINWTAMATLISFFFLFDNHQDMKRISTKGTTNQTYP